MGCALLLVFMLANAILGAFLWPYSLNSWLEFFGKMPQVVWWHGVILGVLPYFGFATVPFAVCTWILMMFIA